MSPWLFSLCLEPLCTKIIGSDKVQGFELEQDGELGDLVLRHGFGNSALKPDHEENNQTGPALDFAGELQSVSRCAH